MADVMMPSMGFRNVLGALLIGSVAAVAGQQAPSFRGVADTVRVFVTVLDKNDRLVPGLERGVFEVRDNGKPQPLTVFDSAPRPLRLIVMLDVSGSMVGNLPLLRAACEQLFLRLGTDDRAKVGTFGIDVVISPTFTNNRSELVAALPVEIDQNAPTPLWKGVNEAMGAFGDTGEARRVILVLSDGKDAPALAFSKIVTQPDIVERARREDVMIYGVGMRSRHPMGAVMPGIGNLGAMMTADLPDPGLSLTATESGGGYFELLPRNDLGVVFTRVLEELHTQYLLGFTPPARDGKVHKVEVKVTTKDLKPRARKSYQAPKD
jgi:VWFA-related protein